MTISSVGSANPYYSYSSYAPATGGTSTDGSADPAAVTESDKKKKPDPADEFLNFAKMSLPEKIRYQFLAAHGLSEDDLKAMDEKERQKIEDQIRQEIEEAVKKETDKKAGGLVDIAA